MLYFSNNILQGITPTAPLSLLHMWLNLEKIDQIVTRAEIQFTTEHYTGV